MPKVVTKINRTEYNEVFRDKGIDCVVSPKLLTSNDIVRYVRAMQNTTGGSVLTLHRLVDDQAEALEFRAAKDTRYLGVPLSKAPIRKGVLIACIKRGSSIIFPTGEDCFQLGDTVIVVTAGERTIGELNEIYH